MKRDIFEFQDDEMNIGEGSEFFDDSVDELYAEMLAEGYFEQEEAEQSVKPLSENFAGEKLSNDISSDISSNAYFSDTDNYESATENEPVLSESVVKSNKKQVEIVKEYMEKSVVREVERSKAVTEETDSLIDASKNQSAETDYRQIADVVYDMLLNRLLAELNGSGTIT